MKDITCGERLKELSAEAYEKAPYLWNPPLRQIIFNVLLGDQTHFMSRNTPGEPSRSSSSAVLLDGRYAANYPRKAPSLVKCSCTLK